MLEFSRLCSTSMSPSGSSGSDWHHHADGEATSEQSAICSPASMNDINDLAGLAPAEGLEAQDVAPRRQRPDSAAEQYLPAFSHARARSPSHPSLILLRLFRWASCVVVAPEACCCLDGVGSLPDGTRLAARAFISAFRAKFGLRVNWLSEVRVGGFSGWRRRWWPISDPLAVLVLRELVGVTGFEPARSEERRVGK